MINSPNKLEFDEKKLEELGAIPFTLKKDTLGLDKLRTFYYKKEMFSKNQNACESMNLILISSHLEIKTLT